MWTPEQQVLDLTPIADNILGYIEANQEGALEWANSGPGLNPFAKLYTNSGGRLQTMFPSLMILTQECEVDLSGSVLQGGLQLTFEGTIGGPNTDELVRDTKNYAKATESMLMNIPTATMTEGTNPAISATVPLESATVLDIVRGLVKVSGFVQVFQIRVKYGFVAEAF